MKPRVGIFGFTGCAGDQLMILNLEDELLDLVGALDLKSFTMASSAVEDSEYDVAFVEGSITTPKQKQKLEEVRKKAKLLVAIGDCAAWGGVQASCNGILTVGEKMKEVYGDEKVWEIYESKPLSAYVKVDFVLPGCPIEKEEFLRAAASLLRGDLPEAVDYPVCVECKLRENGCLMLEGKLCLGPLTVGGCKARCPSLRVDCIGCRGVIEGEARVKSAMQVFKEAGFKPDYVRARLRMFAANYPEILEVKG